MNKLFAALFASVLLFGQSMAMADEHGCGLGYPDQRFDLPDRDQALAPLRACYTQKIKAAKVGIDETSLVRSLMTETCRSQTADLLKEYSGTTALGTTPESQRQTVECWARGLARWVRDGSANGAKAKK